MTQYKSSKQMFFPLIINFLLVIVFLSSMPVAPVSAQNFEDQYGPELKSVPYNVRVRYAKESGQPWSEATYDERLNYLDALYREEMALKMHDDQVANDKLSAEMQKEANKEYVKNAELQKENSRAMAKIYKKQAEDQKKYQLQIRSMQQRQKIDQLRERDQ